jgi:G2/mitotic-specific cyclin 3/4
MQAGAIKAANKKVLGEANANMRLAQPAKDDSEVGKASPGKLIAQESMKSANTATFARPAARPLVQKAVTVQTASVVVAPAPTKPQPSITSIPIEAEPAKKVVAKKSLKVLKEVQEAKPQQTQPESLKPAPVPTLPMPLKQGIVPSKPTQPLSVAQVVPEFSVASAGEVKHQEVRKTESVPLKDEPAPRPLAKTPGVAVSYLPPGFASEQEFQTLVDYHTTQYQLQQHNLNGYPVINGQVPYLPTIQPPQEQYYDIDEEEYGYDDGYTTARSFGLQGESTGGVTTVLAPKITDKIKAELEIAKEFVEATRPPEDIEDEQWDTSMVAEYGDEIFDYMRDLETRMAPNPRYMDQQTEIQWSMRAVLMDWVIQVHQRFNLLPETLFLTVNYIDRFLSCKIVSLGKLQLVGATAIFVAAKYEEVQCPTISEIIYMVDGGYSADELLKAERFMLSMLQFELGWPGPMSFLRRISKADDYDLETRTLAKYFLEVTVMDERFVGCTPSFLAAGAHCMARLMIHNDEWSKAHVYYSNYTWSQLRQLLLAILECCEDPHKHHSAVYDKYTDKRYKRASLYVAGKMAEGFRIPVENPPPQPDSPRQGMNGLSGMMR